MIPSGQKGMDAYTRAQARELLAQFEQHVTPLRCTCGHLATSHAGNGMCVECQCWGLRCVVLTTMPMCRSCSGIRGVMMIKTEPATPVQCPSCGGVKFAWQDKATQASWQIHGKCLNCGVIVYRAKYHHFSTHCYCGNPKEHYDVTITS